MTSIFPVSNDAFKQFTKNLNEKLIKGSDGQYRRKPSFLSAMIAESLPEKGSNYNINTLKAELKQNNNTNQKTSALTSYNSNTLYKVVKEGKKLRKETGIELWDAYHQVAVKYRLPNPDKIASVCRVPVEDDEFHRVEIGNVVIILFVGENYGQGSKRDLNIGGFNMPDKCKYRRSDLWTGAVAYGEVLTIAYPSEYGNHKVDLTDYHICKYSNSEARIQLTNLTRNEVLLLGKHLCIDVENQQIESYKDIPFNNITSSQPFYHLQEWALKHKRTTKNSTSSYFENWGNIALSHPMVIT